MSSRFPSLLPSPARKNNLGLLSLEILSSHIHGNVGYLLVSVLNIPRYDVPLIRPLRPPGHHYAHLYHGAE